MWRRGGGEDHSPLRRTASGILCYGAVFLPLIFHLLRGLLGSGLGEKGRDGLGGHVAGVGAPDLE